MIKLMCLKKMIRHTKKILYYRDNEKLNEIFDEIGDEIILTQSII